jgi:hypothetical protein
MCLECEATNDYGTEARTRSARACEGHGRRHWKDAGGARACRRRWVRHWVWLHRGGVKWCDFARLAELT